MQNSKIRSSRDLTGGALIVAGYVALSPQTRAKVRKASRKVVRRILKSVDRFTGGN